MIILASIVPWTAVSLVTIYDVENPYAVIGIISILLTGIFGILLALMSAMAMSSVNINLEETLMEIRVLRYFLTVIREESITKASEVLHITQPTLSRQLAQMEEEIGVKLFDRGTRKIKLTNEGILLRRRAEEILQLVDKTEKELVEQEEQVEGRISIGCGEIASVQLLCHPILYKDFARL